jgi:hypothetical protein
MISPMVWTGSSAATSTRKSHQPRASAGARISRERARSQGSSRSIARGAKARLASAADARVRGRVRRVEHRAHDGAGREAGERGAAALAPRTRLRRERRGVAHDAQQVVVTADHPEALAAGRARRRRLPPQGSLAAKEA